MKEPDMPKIGIGKLVNLGACEICGQPVMVAANIVDICSVPITTCSRECGEKKAKGEGEAIGA